MIMWNFRTPLHLLASLVWNFSEFFGIGLGNLAPHIFGIVINAKKIKED